jgi:hypothetical protein
MHVNRRGVVGILLFLVVAIVAGCAQLPPPETQQEVQKLREQVATLEARVEESQAAPATETQQEVQKLREQVAALETRVEGSQAAAATETQQEIQKLREQVTALEARVEESQAAPAPGAVSTDEIMTRMAGLQQRMQEMMQQGTPDPEALAEMQREMQALRQQMQQVMGGGPAMPDMGPLMGPMSQMMTMMQSMMQTMPNPEALAEMQREMADMQQQMQSMAAPAQVMGGMAGPLQSMDMVPPVKGYYAGEEILFIHTEASDPQVADMLTMMMGPQVVLMPRLAEAPESLLANLYVFTNGLQGGGPFGFQPDVFDAVPGDEGYSPLRAINLVAWEEGVTARELRSVEEVKAAESKGEVTIKQPGIVVNMPVLTWPGGHR